MRKLNKEVHMIFIDFKKTYDCIHRDSLMSILEQYGLPLKLVNLIKASAMNTEIKIQVGNSLSTATQVKTGLRQGDALSPILFNLTLEKVVQSTSFEHGDVKIGETKISLLAYADDLVLLAENKEDIIEQTQELLEAAKRVGLEINVKKTKYMIAQRSVLPEDVHTHLEVGAYKFNRVQKFQYLGTLITQNNEIQEEIKARIHAVNRCYFGLNKLFKSRILSKNLKIQLYRTLIRPVVMYGCETWTLHKIQQNNLLVFERKILRSIFGPCIDSHTGEWRIRYNVEIRELYQKPNIVQ